MQKLSGITALLVAVAPAVAFAAPKTFAQLVDWLVAIINLVIPTLIALAIVLFFWNTLHGIWEATQGGKTDSKKLRETITWGIIIMFVMVSIWGILNLLRSTLLL